MHASHLARSTSPAQTEGHEYCSNQSVIPDPSNAARGPTSSTGWRGADSPGCRLWPLPTTVTTASVFSSTRPAHLRPRDPPHYESASDRTATCTVTPPPTTVVPRTCPLHVRGQANRPPPAFPPACHMQLKRRVH